ncbi:hypothetical protein KR093_009331, partial [Drosophila rubida]
PDLPPRIFYVCSLCLRQYELTEDLKGHMMFYHGCQLISGSWQPDSKQLETPLAAAPLPPPPTELQPMPFKDFRLALRVNMLVPCTQGSGCVHKFADVCKQMLHVKCHKGEAYNCSECGVDFVNWRRCSVHLWKKHQIDVDMLQCPILGCGYKSSLSALVWRHMRVHKKWRGRVLRRELRRTNKQQQQQLMDEATDSQAPSQPAVGVNKNKYYAEKTCEICQQKFVNGKTLSKHVKTVHNKIKPFICSVCGKKTARKASLIIHMRQHTGEKPLTCEHCKFSTRDPSSLFKHRQRHRKDGTHVAT